MKLIVSIMFFDGLESCRYDYNVFELLLVLF